VPSESSAIASSRERCQVLVDDILDAVEEIGMLLVVPSEVVAAVGDVTAD